MMMSIKLEAAAFRFISNCQLFKYNGTSIYGHLTSTIFLVITVTVSHSRIISHCKNKYRMFVLVRSFAKLKIFQKSKNNLEVGGWVQVPFG